MLSNMKKCNSVTAGRAQQMIYMFLIDAFFICTDLVAAVPLVLPNCVALSW